jgi:hypothetical protein
LKEQAEVANVLEGANAVIGLQSMELTQVCCLRPKFGFISRFSSSNGDLL